MTTRMIVPSFDGEAPRFGAVAMARSMSFSAVLSYGVMTSIRASGACTLASWPSGVGRAVVVDEDALEQRGVRATGADRVEVVLGHVDRLGHAVARLLQHVRDHAVAPSSSEVSRAPGDR